MAAHELRHARRSSQPLLKRGRCPEAQPRSRSNKGAIANRLVHRRPTPGMCATSQVEDHACDAPPPPRSDSHPPLEGGQAPGGQPQSLANAGGFCGQSPLQAAETTCARNSGNGFSVRRARHSSAETEPPEPPARRCNACGVKRRRRPGIAGAAGGNSGDIGLYPLCLGPLNCPFSKAFVSGFLIFKSPTTMD